MPRVRDRQATRRRLIEVARRRFSEQGFAETRIESVIRDANLTKGALYHHFASKLELFTAVIEVAEAELLDWLASLTPHPQGAWAELREFCGLYLSACSDPQLRRLLLLDGPAQLPVARLNRRRLAALNSHLAIALDDDVEAAERLGPLLLGGLHAEAVKLDREQPNHWRESQRAVTWILEGLRLVQQQGSLAAPAGKGIWDRDPWDAWSSR